jgi:hypothetical protein
VGPHVTIDKVPCVFGNQSSSVYFHMREEDVIIFATMCHATSTWCLIRLYKVMLGGMPCRVHVSVVLYGPPSWEFKECILMAYLGGLVLSGVKCSMGEVSFGVWFQGLEHQINSN